jgi:hypothetical protein
MALYQKVMDGEKTFKEAEAILLDEGIRYPFVPKNPRDFRLSAPDIEGGQLVVNRIMELYGTDETVGEKVVRKLYRFPVVFPDAPGGVEGFFKSEFSVPVGALRYHSVYSDAGERSCIYLKPVNADEQKQAKRKKWLRREPTIRGKCDPSVCPEFASGACRFRGDLQFFIPGVTGVVPFSMPTGSQYAAEDIFLRLEDIHEKCRGQIPRFDPHGNPVFYITKALKQRTYFDEHGVEKRGLQWVPVLESSIDMSKLMQIEEQRRMQLAAPQAAPTNVALPSGWLPAPASEHDEWSGPLAFPMPRREPVFVQQEAASSPREPEKEIGLPNSVDTGGVEAALDWIEALGDQLGIADDLVSFMERKYGETWFEGDKPVTIRAELMQMQEKVGEGLRTYIQLLLSIYANGVPPDVALKYLRMKVGSMKNPETVARARKTLDDLLDQGVAVAVTHMRQEVEKAMG